MLSSTSSLAIHGIGVKLTAYIHSVLIRLLIDSFGRAKHWNFWFSSWKRTSIFAREQNYRKIFYIVIVIFCEFSGSEYPKWSWREPSCTDSCILEKLYPTHQVNSKCHTSPSCFIRDNEVCLAYETQNIFCTVFSLLYGCWLVMKLESNLKWGFWFLCWILFRFSLWLAGLFGSFAAVGLFHWWGNCALMKIQSFWFHCFAICCQSWMVDFEMTTVVPAIGTYSLKCLVLWVLNLGPALG